MAKVITTIYIEEEFKDQLRSRGVNLSDFVNKALGKELGFNQMEDPFQHDGVKKMLPEARKHIQKNRKFARGWSNRIFNETGQYVDPDTLVTKLGLKTKSSKKGHKK